MESQSDDVLPLIHKVHRVPETSQTSSGKKNQAKVPKRIHKAEREKMKREHLNDLFLELANALDLPEQNNGKASILGETTRIIKDLLSQLNCLKHENAALLSESQYVATEKKELQDENEALQYQIQKLQGVLKERMAELEQLDLNIVPSECQEPASGEDHLNLRLPALGMLSQEAPMVGPVYVIPMCSEAQVCSEPTCGPSRIVPGVCKPHPRYPTPADSWPSKLLPKQLESTKECQQNGNS